MAIPRPGTEEHRRLVELVLGRFRQSETQLKARHERWRESERAYRLFVDPDQVQEPIEPLTEHSELLFPYPTSVVVPMQYAIVQTLISFYVAMFSNQSPYLRVGARNPESVGPAKAQELVCGYQLDYWGWTPFLYQYFLDAFRYGMGVAKCCWRIDERMQQVRETVQLSLMGESFAVQMRRERPVVEYEGNYIESVDPFAFRPDPRHPIAKFQDGSYCGEECYRSYFDLLRKEAEGLYENVREIPQKTIEGLGRAGASGTFSVSDRERIMQANNYFGEHPKDGDAGMVLVQAGMFDVIPAQFGMGDSEQPERWLVTLANCSVVIRAEPYPYDHQDYYYAVMESSPDQHSLLNPGVMELMEPLSQHVSWLYNSHIENVRKSINNQFVVDPAVVNMDDVLNPSAGKIIRVKPEYYGSGVADRAIKQLEVRDVTSSHISTAQVLIDLLQRLSAANDTIQGEPDSTRKTASEVTMTTNLATSRLRTLAKVYAATGLQPLFRQMVQNNMSFLSQEQYVRIAGTLEQEYQAVGRSVAGGVSIRPEDIQGLFDYPIFDASSALDPIRWSQTWMQIQQMALTNPAISGQVDHMALFKQVVHSLGITDVARFLVPQQVQVMPDQQVAQQVQRGNLIPFPGGPQQSPAQQAA